MDANRFREAYAKLEVLDDRLSYKIRQKSLKTRGTNPEQLDERVRDLADCVLELKDIVRTFGKLTGLETKVDADVEGKVSVEFRDVPWDFALQQILSTNGCEYQIEGKTLHVRRIR